MVFVVTHLILPFLRDVVVLFPAFRERLLLSSSRTDPVDFLLLKTRPEHFSKGREPISQRTKATFRNNEELMKVLSFQIYCNAQVLEAMLEQKVGSLMRLS